MTNDTKTDALAVADALFNGRTTSANIALAVETLRTQHSDLGVKDVQLAGAHQRAQVLLAAKEKWRLRATDAEAQLSSIGAGGVELLRKRECLQQSAESVHATLSPRAQYRTSIENVRDALTALQAAPPAPADLSSPQEAQLSADTLYLLRRLLSNQHTLTGPEFRAELAKIVDEACRTQAPPAPAAVAVPADWRELLEFWIAPQLERARKEAFNRGDGPSANGYLDALDKARAALAAAPAQAVAVPVGLDGVHVGRLPTMNQDEYPGLGDWWVQLRIGKDKNEVLARVYGNSPEQAHARAAALAAPAQEHATQLAGQRQFQQRVQPWLLACFGAEIAGDKQERNHRFLEEALELVQACGCTASEAHQLVDYVFGRPVGEPAQEVGGVMVTLAALCLAGGLDMHQAGEVELARIWGKVEQIRAKQAAKPKHSPLPAAPAQAQEDARTYAPIEPVSIIWHESPEAVDAAHWAPTCEAEGITLEELRQGTSVGVDARGVETEFSQAEVLQSMRDMGFWGFVDTKTRTIHAWADPTTPDSAIMEFLGHEIGHVTGMPDERDWEEEQRADQYGGLVKMAHALLMTRPGAQEDARDAVRLDWLGADGGMCVFHLCNAWYTRAGYGQPYRKRANLRDAIDAARAAQGGAA